MNGFKFILFSFILLLAYESSAQNLRTRVQWGKKAKVTNQTSIEEILLSDKSKTIIYKTNKPNSNTFGEKHYLELYDQKLSLDKYVNLDKILFKDKKTIETVFGLKDKLFILSMDRRNSINEKGIYLHNVDPKNLSFNTHEDPVKEIETQNVNLDFGLEVVKSKQLNYFAVLYNQTPKLNSYDKIGYLLFDAEGHLVKDEIISVPYISKHILLANFTLSNQGILTFTGDLYTNTLHAKSFKKKKPNYTPIVFLFEDELRQQEIEIEDKLIDDYKIAFDENNSVFVSGFFANENIESQNGMFLSKFSGEDLSMYTTTFFTFPLQMFASNIKPSDYKKLIKKDKKYGYINLNNYINREIFVSKSGEAYFITEQQYKIFNQQQLTMRPNNFLFNQQSQDIEYFFNAILIGKVNANGKLVYFKNIPKKQTSSATDINYCSFFFHLANDNLLLAYNDSKKNFNADFSEKSPSPFRLSKNTNMVICRINKSGKLYYKKVIDSKQSKIYSLPFFMKALNDETYMLLTRKNNFQKLVKLILL